MLINQTRIGHMITKQSHSILEIQSSYGRTDKRTDNGFKGVKMTKYVNNNSVWRDLDWIRNKPTLFIIVSMLTCRSISNTSFSAMLILFSTTNSISRLYSMRLEPTKLFFN